MPKVIREAHFMIERLTAFASKAKKRRKRELAQDAVVVIEKLVEHSKAEYERGKRYGEAIGLQDRARDNSIRTTPHV